MLQNVLRKKHYSDISQLYLLLDEILDACMTCFKTYLLFIKVINLHYNQKTYLNIAFTILQNERNKTGILENHFSFYFNMLLDRFGLLEQ